VKAKYYIVQQGDDSVFVYDGNRYEIISAPEALRKETREIGASMQETFMGALAAEYLETKNIVRACRLAIVVSMLTRSKFGNLEKMMSRAELEQFAAENGFELYK
jgi:sugar/nucleoside kinase (ribokinase family)